MCCVPALTRFPPPITRVPPAYNQRAQGGAVAPDPSGRGYLLVRSRGDLYRLNFDEGGELHVEPIGLRVPINNAEF